MTSPPRPGLFHDRNMCDCSLWQGLLQGLQVQGDELGIVLRYFFFPLNSIFSTLWSSGGSRRRLLLRETSGVAIVANALNSCALANPVPTGSLAFQPPQRGIKKEKLEEKSKTERGAWKCQAVRFKAIKGNYVGGAGKQRNRRRQLPGRWEMLVGQGGWEQMEP